MKTYTGMAFLDNNFIEIKYLADCPEYINIIAEWLYEEFGRYHHADSKENRVKRLKSYCNKHILPITFTASYKSNPIATASLLKQNMDSHPELSPWLASVYTLSDFRNRGIAKLLINHVIKKACELNFEHLFLFTDEFAAYYNKFGWETILVEEYYQERVSLMKLDITNFPQ